MPKHRMTDFERAEQRADIADSIGDGPGRSLPAGKINAIIARELAQARAQGAVLYVPEQPRKGRGKTSDGEGW